MTDRECLDEYYHQDVTIRVWKRSDGNWSIAPWLFSIQKHGESERNFRGVPNYCVSKRSAFMRAYHRAKWLASGNWHKHYK